MNKLATTLSLIALLAACDNEQPFTFDDPEAEDETTDDEIVVTDPTDPDEELVLSGFVNNGTNTALPENTALNLTDVTFTPGSNTITVSGAGLDTTPTAGVFTRNANLDVAGYTAYSVQEDPLDRMFIALVTQSADGSVEGGVILDGGQFNRFFGGSFYRRNGTYTPFVPSQPNQGLVSYSGEYAGLSNLGTTNSAELIPAPAGTDASLLPRQSARVTGDVFINADFADNVINGGIVNRAFVDNVGVPLEDVALTVTDITDDGTFVGAVEDDELAVIGTYAGAFGGTQASAVAGSVQISDYIEDAENEQEFGSFVLSRCGTIGEGALCASVDPQ